MEEKIKICHLTSVHKRYDTRIFIKQCSSLAKIKHFEVNLIVADGKGNEIKNQVNIIDVGEKNNSRILRVTNTGRDIYKAAKNLKANIYHFHDPELILVGLKLKRKGAKVVFDSHEDVPNQILSKPYLSKFLKIILSNAVRFYENYSCKKFDYIITATSHIRDKFLKINKNTANINNFPIITELSNTITWQQKKEIISYVGGISTVRGVREMVKAMEHTKHPKTRLDLVGPFQDDEVETEVKTYSGWNKVNEHGFLNRKQVNEILAYSKAGLVILHPTISYKDALPVKMFEYMAAGIPVISSNIKLWEKIIDKEECGICIDPFKPEEIAKAIDFIMDNPKEGERMAANGKKAVLERYNWGNEEKKLLHVYKKIINT